MVTAQNVKDFMTQPAIVLKGGVSVAHRQSVAKAIVEAAFTQHNNSTYALGGENLTIAELGRKIQKIHGVGRALLFLDYKLAMRLVKALKVVKLKLFEEEAVKYAGFNWYCSS